MALKKESNSLGSEQEKSQNEYSSLLELNKLDNKKEIESQLLEVSKADENENGFLDFGFNQSILNSLIKKGGTSLAPIMDVNSFNTWTSSSSKPRWRSLSTR